MTNARSLSPFKAILHSLNPWNSLRLDEDDPFVYFPRTQSADGSSSTLTNREMFDQAIAELNQLTEPDEIDDAIECARETLREVKELTDYQDSKATRLLTIITFLGALAGILFTLFLDAYPIPKSLQRVDLSVLQFILILTSCAAFGLYTLLSICGALVTFYAIRTRFRYPNNSRAGSARSFLFYRSILEVTPQNWAASFLDPSDKTKVSPRLKLEYFKNYVTESYLISAKVADKIRYLVPSQIIQLWAISSLFVWVIVSAAVIAIVPSQLAGEVSKLSPVTSTLQSTPPTHDESRLNPIRIDPFPPHAPLP